MTPPLLEVRDLVKTFPVGAGQVVHAVGGVSFSIAPGEALGLVGESGSGKSTIGMLITRLLPATRGRILFEGEDITDCPERRMRRLRAAIQIVFQDPWGVLDPRQAVGRALEEPLLLHTRLSPAERAAQVRELAERVHLPAATLKRFAHELSGGQLQRVAIARAIATRPRLLVLDEPTSSLDLSVRAGVLKVIEEIRSETGVATLMISHDLDTIKLTTERVLVLYLGRVMEEGATRAVFAQAMHPYTQTLLSAALPADPDAILRRHVVRGEIPSPVNLPPGCLFASRCPLAIDACRVSAPPLQALGEAHAAACIRIEGDNHRLDRIPVHSNQPFPTPP